MQTLLVIKLATADLDEGAEKYWLIPLPVYTNFTLMDEQSEHRE